MAIDYSMCWEDPAVLRSALRPRKGARVLVVASGGENAFALLLDDPSLVVATDTNIEQLHLLALKIAGIRALTFREFAIFLGFMPGERKALYLKCRRHLDEEAALFWDGHQALIARGVVHAGRFERFLRVFRRMVLPLVLTRRQRQEYLASQSLRAQRSFYETQWDGVLWRSIFRIFFSRILLRSARAKGAFRHSEGGAAEHYLGLARHGITATPVQENCFIHYIMTGTIPVPFPGHPYLDERNFALLRKRVGRIRLAHEDVRDIIGHMDEGFDAYALSDIFEFMDEASYRTVLERIAAQGRRARICYWNNLVPRHGQRIDGLRVVDTAALARQDRVFFYSRIVVEETVSGRRMRRAGR